MHPCTTVYHSFRERGRWGSRPVPPRGYARRQDRGTPKLSVVALRNVSGTTKGTMVHGTGGASYWCFWHAAALGNARGSSGN